VIEISAFKIQFYIRHELVGRALAKLNPFLMSQKNHKNLFRTQNILFIILVFVYLLFKILTIARQSFFATEHVRIE
jgi:hypothetical protein